MQSLGSKDIQTKVENLSFTFDKTLFDSFKDLPYKDKSLELFIQTVEARVETVKNSIDRLQLQITNLKQELEKQQQKTHDITASAHNALQLKKLEDLTTKYRVTFNPKTLELNPKFIKFIEDYEQGAIFDFMVGKED